MLRLTLITQDNYFSLGLNGISSLFKAIGQEELDSVQALDQPFMQALCRMKTHPYGFTADFKKKFLATIGKSQGQKILITHDWLTSYESPRAQYLMRIVAFLNQGHTLDQAQDHLKNQLINQFNNQKTIEL